MIDRIRQLELAVIEAAVRWVPQLPSIQAEHALQDAIQALNFGCPECNRGGHVCPGDGKSIPHGAGSCGEHDEPATTEWIGSTFLHIVIGDRVRIGQEEADVTRAMVQLWHARDGEWVPSGQKKADGTDKMMKMVIKDDHWEVRAAFHLATGQDLPLTLFPPETAVEILCTPARKAQLALSHAGFIGTTEI